MDAHIREASLLVRYVSEAHLRTVANRWGLDDYFARNGSSYVEWLNDEKSTLRKLYGYQPTLAQLKRSVAAAIMDEDDFYDYLCHVGPAEDLEDGATLDRLSLAAAAIIVGLYQDGPAVSQVSRKGGRWRTRN